MIINNHPELVISLRFLKNKIKEIFDQLNLKNCQIELTLCTDSFMKQQNKKHRGVNGSTDVLSFPQLEKQKKRSDYHGQFLGDVLISLDQAQKQAKEQDLSLSQEVLFLTLHSVLHLIGYDHATKTERMEMQFLESKIWGKLARLS